MISRYRLVYVVGAILNTEYRRLWLNSGTALERAFDKYDLKTILIKRIKLKAVRALT